MRLYHFLNEEFGLKALRDRRLKIARIMELNDPFEFLGVDLSNCELRRGVEAAKAELSATNGLLCFSKNWKNPVLWGHYADKHRGICLGFDIPNTFPQKIDYIETRFPWPASIDQTFMKKLLFTKFAHWSYEDEYRVYISLEDEVNGLYFSDFSKNLNLKQVIVGGQATLTRAQIDTALGDLKGEVEIFKSRPAFTSFNVVRNKNNSLWG